MNVDARDTWSQIQEAESWAGEIRANLVRLFAVGLFYAQHLVRLVLFHRDDAALMEHHVRISGLVFTWTIFITAVHFMLLTRSHSKWLKYVTVVLDVTLLTWVLIISAGPRSPLVVLYLLVIAAAPLRLSLPCVYFSSACCAVGYLVLLAQYAWVQVGYEAYYSDPTLRIPRSQQVIFLLTIGCAGVLAGQAVRQMRRLAVEPSAYLEQRGTETSSEGSE